jgi:hypothetical protein
VPKETELLSTAIQKMDAVQKVMEDNAKAINELKQLLLQINTQKEIGLEDSHDEPYSPTKPEITPGFSSNSKPTKKAWKK